MDPNAFEPLHDLPGVFAAIPASLSSVAEIRSHLEQLDNTRSDAAIRLEPIKSEIEPVSRAVGVVVTDYFVDCAAVTALASSMQKALSNLLQAGKSPSGKMNEIPQEETHLLVDLWGQVEASRALYEFVLRQSESFRPGSSAVTADSLKAQYRVLMTGIERVIVHIGTSLGRRSSMADAAILMDWALSCIGHSDYGSLKGAVDREIEGLAL